MHAGAKRAGRARNGFTLLEIIVAVAIMIILAAVITPNLTRSLDQAAVQRSLTLLTAINNGVTAFRQDVGFYPSRLTQLTTPLVAGDRNSCNALYSTGQRNNWAGPYLDQVMTTSGTSLAIGQAQNLLVRTPAFGGNGTLSLQVTRVSQDNATSLNDIIDGDSSGTTGTVRWGAPDAQGFVTVELVQPVGAC